MPSFFISFSVRTSTSTPSASSSLALAANSTGPSMLAGSLTRSRARMTPSATASASAKAFLAAVGGGGDDRQLDLGRLLAIVGIVLLGLVFVEAVGAQQDAERDVGRILAADLEAGRIEIDGHLARLPELALDGAAELQPALRVDCRRFADADRRQFGRMPSPKARAGRAMESGLPANFDTFTALSITFAGSACSAEAPNLAPAAASSTARPSLGLALRVKETSILGIVTPQDWATSAARAIFLVSTANARAGFGFS